MDQAEREAMNDNGERDPGELREEIQRTRIELGDTVEELAAKADVKGQAQAKVADTKARAADLGHQAAEKAGHVTGRLKEATPDDVQRAASQAADTVAGQAQARPIPAAAIAAFLVGYLFGRIAGRRRRRED